MHKSELNSTAKFSPRYPALWAVIAACLILVACAFWCPSDKSEVDVLQEKLVTQQGVSRQLLQHFCELGPLVVSNIGDPSHLTSNDRALLQTWVNCDENLLLRLQQTDDTMDWEHVGIFQRAGMMRELLGDYPQAIGHLQAATSRLKSLSQTQPDELTYLLTRVENQGNLGWCQAQLNQPFEAVNSCVLGLSILAKSASALEAVDGYRILGAISRYKQLGEHLSARELRIQIALFEINTWSRLCGQDPEDQEAQRGLKQAQQLLEQLQRNIETSYAS